MLHSRLRLLQAALSGNEPGRRHDVETLSDETQGNINIEVLP